MFWWANLSLRIAGKDAMAKAGEDGSFDSPGFVKAGEELKKLIDMKPFQDGFLAAPWDGAGGEAADDRQRPRGDGPDGPVGAVDVRRQHQGQGRDARPTSAGSRSRPSTAAPARPSEQFGGGDGFAFGKDAPPEAVDFAKFLVTLRRRQQGRRQRRASCRWPRAPSRPSTDPNMKSVLDARGEADFVQLYLDQAYAPAVGQAVNDAVQELFAGKASPQDVAGKIADAAKAG